MDFENRYLAKDGTYRWLSWRSVAVEEHGLIYAVARDIEEQKRIEQLKNDFVSVVSHELRTPLTSIRGSLGLIAGGVAGELPAKARSLVDIAAKNCERLVRLINDILDVEKIESGQMGFRLAPVDLAALAGQAVESNRAYAEGYEVELRISFLGEAVEGRGARVWGDADRLLQVITNLISNAVKFSPRGGVVEVAVTRGEGEARVAVTDHGPGVPPEFRQRIFEKFAQADSSSTREKGGTGLGSEHLARHRRAPPGADRLRQRAGDGDGVLLRSAPLRSAGTEGARCRRAGYRHRPADPDLRGRPRCRPPARPDAGARGVPRGRGARRARRPGGFSASAPTPR